MCRGGDAYLLLARVWPVRIRRWIKGTPLEEAAPRHTHTPPPPHAIALQIPRR